MGKKILVNLPDGAIAGVERYLAKVPDLRKRLFSRVLGGQSTATEAIKAKCFDCVGFEDIEGSVYGCKAHTCPLWAWRPQSSV